jgi:hypothetical protein
MRGRGGSLLTVKKSRYALTSYSLSLRSRYCTSKQHTRSMRITTRVDFLQIGRPPKCPTEVTKDDERSRIYILKD